MPMCLHVEAAGYDVLVNADTVREVVILADLVFDDSAPGFRPWRGEAMAVLDLPVALGGSEGQRPVAVVVETGRDGCVFLDVEKIVGMERYDTCDVRGLPPLPGAVEALFDGIVLADPTRRGFLRLRSDAIALMMAERCGED